MVWTYNGGNVPANTQMMIPEPGVLQLQISTVKKENAGVYVCLGHLGVSRDAVYIQLEIYGNNLEETHSVNGACTIVNY